MIESLLLDGVSVLWKFDLPGDLDELDENKSKSRVVSIGVAG